MDYESSRDVSNTYDRLTVTHVCSRDTQNIDWMRLTNVLVVFGCTAVKYNAKCANDNVLILYVLT